ncbi:MAG: hypothetical protein ACJ72M_08805 [Propionibacteriaceae bacterium]|jgi:hypothetical protein
MTDSHLDNRYIQQSSPSPFPATNNLQVGAAPMPYGQQYGAPPQEHPQGTLILIFGIIGVFFSVFAAIAWYLGANAMKEIRASGVRYSNESNINAGRILGKIVTIIALVFLAIVIVMWLIFGFFFAAVGMSSL